MTPIVTTASANRTTSAQRTRQLMVLALFKPNSLCIGPTLASGGCVLKLCEGQCATQCAEQCRSVRATMPGVRGPLRMRHHPKHPAIGGQNSSDVCLGAVRVYPCR